METVSTGEILNDLNHAVWVILDAYKNSFKWRKLGNNTEFTAIEKQKEIISYKGTRMVKDGEDWHGLQTTEFKNLDYTCLHAQAVRFSNVTCS